MLTCQHSHAARGLLVRTLIAVLASVLLLTACAGGFSAAAKGADGSPQSPVSGSICVAAGEASLPAPPVGVSARGAVLMEAETGEIAFGINQNARLPMASTTKIMTALCALEMLPPETIVTVSPDAVGVEGSSIYLVAGERLTMEELLYALLLESANDAAAAIAIAVSGSVESFAALMNRRAADMGLTDTHFVNPHGLDDPEHYTTAKELALIAREALKNPFFREICGTRRKVIPLQGEKGVRLLLNHNRLLGSYEGCIGVKTGYTKKTGRCLVSAAERDGVTLIAVTLGAPNDWRDHTAMLDYGFGLYDSVTLCEPDFYHAPLWLVAGQAEYVMVSNTEVLTVTLRNNHGPVRCIVELPRFAYAPVRAGEQVGRLRFFEESPDGERRELGSVPLYAAYGVDAVTYKKGLWEWLFSR